jgi:3'-5' exoribonuclease
MKRIYVRDLREGLKIDDVFAVASKSVANARNGSRYLRLKLTDRTGTIDAVKWNASDAEVMSFGENELMHVRGTAGTYNGELQLTVDSLQKPNYPVDPADFLRVSERDPDEMLADLRLILGSVTSPDLSRLVWSFFDDPEFASKFRQAPAAKSVHHAWVGGLLEHTLNVVRSCAALADLYPQADRDLLLTAAALHDIGKIDEYACSVTIRFTDAGHLIGHVVGGTMMVKEAAESIEGFNPLLSLALQHAVLAHHGTKEFGSPKRPKSLEAYLLHVADDLDAKVEMFRKAISDSDENGEDGLFTKRHLYLDRPIFKGLNRQPETADSRDESDLDLLAVDPDWDPFAEE